MSHLLSTGPVLWSTGCGHGRGKQQIPDPGGLVDLKDVAICHTLLKKEKGKRFQGKGIYRGESGKALYREAVIPYWVFGQREVLLWWECASGREDTAWVNGSCIRNQRKWSQSPGSCGLKTLTLVRDR